MDCGARAAFNVTGSADMSCAPGLYPSSERKRPSVGLRRRKRFLCAVHRTGFDQRPLSPEAFWSPELKLSRPAENDEEWQPGC